MKIRVHLWLKDFCLFLVGIACIAFLSSCANRHFEVVAEGPPVDAPHYVDLATGAQIATMHFPAGSYSFYAVDDRGYYYRAPRRIVEHTGGSSRSHDGGIYVSRKGPKRLRGYVVLAGGLTHLGNLTRAHYQFRD